MSSHTRSTRGLGVVICAIAGITPTAFAQWQPAPRPPAPVYTQQDVAAVNATIERFGFDFVTVGAPGNRSWIESERQFPNGWTPSHIDDRGRVDYSYRIMRTEVVTRQYADFVLAFRPFWLSLADRPGAIETGSPTDSRFTSRGISVFGGFEIRPGWIDSTAQISWRNAARYANWLHNGAPTDAASLTWDTFHTGAYTFTDESFTSSTRGTPITRNEDARFWLPSLDELLKAAYYDPNRYGEGEEGYWLYPHSSNDTPVRGAPGEGDYGPVPGEDLWESMLPGRYPNAASPWGVLDVLGTESEWVETPYAIRQLSDGTFILGTPERIRVGGSNLFENSQLDRWSSSSEWSVSNGFRLATIVPAPSALSVFAGAGVLIRRKRS
ncbi:MAG: SUMF1/EgtB/PvdO family nonheme iron enzyme [Phycisphaeraceae bacterium]|nr:SUMF1/EgtB/PvdO family nonheme iron enzyme [Phycisphaeraceae bacterium]